ncbi:ubiquitin ligase (cullin) of SCF [Naganishia albida]|nr:ubiquitin ligase (cullin) of SCF [Naganishia albida]
MSSDGKGHIEPVADEPTKGPPITADLPTAWGFLEAGVDRIMLNFTAGMTNHYYVLCYTTCYNYCTNTKGIGASGLAGRGAGAARGSANVMGSDLYNKLTDYFKRHIARLRKQCETLSDVALIQYYYKEWESYTRGANYVSRLFTYLNRYWVKREKDEGRKGVYPVYILALVQWREHMFENLYGKNNKLVNAVLQQIENHRNGEEVDTTLLKGVVESFVTLGMNDENGTQRATLDLYRDKFQTHFLAATEAYYKKESEAFLAENSISDFLKKVEARLEEEARRVDLYLHNSTTKGLMNKCDKALIVDHMALLQEEFQKMLDADRNEDLARTWTLLARIPDGLNPLRETFEEHVKKSGLAAVEGVAAALNSAAPEAGAKADTVDPTAYIQALLSVHKKNADVVEKAFKGEKGFGEALDRACKQYCNHNAVATTTSRSPELLGQYVNLVLSKSNKEASDDANLEESLNEAMTIFKYIDDKDVFQKFYSRNLATRLVKQRSASDEAEASMISKLKEVCGVDYTIRLQKMVQDVTISKETTAEFKERMRQGGDIASDIDFSIIVGSTVNWPITAQQTEFAIPKQLSSIYERFKGFYTTNHSGRKLSWMWHLSNNEIKMTFTKPNYILMASSYQTAILLQFNDTHSLSYAELSEATQLADAQLKPVLNLLVKAKLLLVDGDQYDLNMNFKSKKIRININQAIRAEQKQESNDVMKAVDEDRKFVYQATIVRIMKMRKTLAHQALIQETVSMISPQFVPKIPHIKQAIDHLIDKEYLERAEGSRDTYNYLA